MELESLAKADWCNGAETGPGVAKPLPCLEGGLLKGYEIWRGRKSSESHQVMCLHTVSVLWLILERVYVWQRLGNSNDPFSNRSGWDV